MEVLEGFQRDTRIFKDVHDDYLWLRTKTVAEKSYHKCFDKTCSSTCVSDGFTVSMMRPHTHQPDASVVHHLKFLAKLRHLAATTNESFKDIFSLAQREHEDGALIAGSFHECVNIMKNARSAVLPALPKSLDEFASIMERTG